MPLTAPASNWKFFLFRFCFCFQSVSCHQQKNPHTRCFLFFILLPYSYQSKWKVIKNCWAATRSLETPKCLRTMGSTSPVRSRCFSRCYHWWSALSPSVAPLLSHSRATCQVYLCDSQGWVLWNMFWRITPTSGREKDVSAAGWRSDSSASTKADSELLISSFFFFHDCPWGLTAIFSGIYCCRCLLW